jgi:ribosomal protein S18 acetylase RimI-like enzyme
MHERMAAISVRPASPGDSEFCWRLHRAAMGPYVARIWGWDDTVQRAFHERWFDATGVRIITCDGLDVGVLDVEDRPAEVFLARIEILPEHQGRGIGTRLLRQLVGDAAIRGRPVVLEVLTSNQRARFLYARLGFHALAAQGEGAVKITMRREAT